MDRIQQWEQSQRVAITRGSVVAFRGGGPQYGRGAHRLTLPGAFVVRDILAAGRRVWLEVFGLDKTAGTFVVFVSGRAYRRADMPGVLWKPYRVKRTAAAAERPKRRKAVAP